MSSAPTPLRFRTSKIVSTSRSLRAFAMCAKRSTHGTCCANCDARNSGAARNASIRTSCFSRSKISSRPLLPARPPVTRRTRWPQRRAPKSARANRGALPAHLPAKTARPYPANDAFSIHCNRLRRSPEFADSLRLPRQYGRDIPGGLTRSISPQSNSAKASRGRWVFHGCPWLAHGV